MNTDSMVWLRVKSLILALGPALGLLLLFIGMVSVFSPLRQSVPTRQNPIEQSMSAMNNLRIEVHVDTTSEDEQAAILGEAVTFTIDIFNASLSAITDVEVIDVFSKNAFEFDIDCDLMCTVLTATQAISTIKQITDRTNLELITTLIVQPEQLMWPKIGSAKFTIAGNDRQRLVFTARIRDRLDGELLNNRVIVSFKSNGIQQVIKDISIPVVVRSSRDNRTFNLPIWQSEAVGIVNDTDWGDFDRDGDLDLALASNLGILVYRNENGRLVEFWKNQDPCTVPNDLCIFSVRWGNFDSREGSLTLELVATGSPGSPSRNFVYEYLPLSQSFGVHSEFNSAVRLFHIEPYQHTKGAPIHLIGLNIDPWSSPYLYINQNSEGFFDHKIEIVNALSWSASVADFNNDGFNEVALVNNSDNIQMYRFTNNSLASIPLEVTAKEYFIEDLDWGDYDGNGYLDLVAADAYTKQVYIYPNIGLIPAAEVIPIGPFSFDGYSVEWGDFNNDGLLDLGNATSPPKVYLNRGAVVKRFDEPDILSTQGITVYPNSLLWYSLNAIDMNDDGSLDLSIGNRSGSSALVANFFLPISTRLQAIEVQNTPATSVAWGDANGDRLLDLLFGAGTSATGLSTAPDAKLYFNLAGEPTAPADLLSAPLRGSGGGPQVVAWANIDDDMSLEVAIGGLDTPLRLYDNFETAIEHSTTLEDLIIQQFSNITDVTALAWGDVNGDGRLDLAVGQANEAITILKNIEPLLDQNPITVSVGSPVAKNDTRTSIAWADFNADYHMDLVIGQSGKPLYLYRNKSDQTFELYERIGITTMVSSVQWVDYDSDGDPDISTASYGDLNRIYQNNNAHFTKSITISTQMSKSTSLDWGDMDGDGDLDLAIGNDGEPNQIFLNLNGTLVERWQSDEISKTTGIAWGDVDNDGDLDLAMSQNGNGRNGIYENFYVSPSHLDENFAKTMVLPNQPSYLSIERPGITGRAYLHSSPEILSGPKSPTVTRPVTISYRLHDSDGSRKLDSAGDTQGDYIFSSTFEYSLDGGAWQKATPAETTPTVPLTTTRLGYVAHFLWDAVADKAISDNARFRIKVIHDNPFGPVQRASTTAISPPFRVRGTTCLWPIDPAIRVNEPPTSPPRTDLYPFFDKLDVTGSIQQGSGQITYLWRFETARAIPIEKSGQRVIFTRDEIKDRKGTPVVLMPGNTYSVTLQVQGEECPMTRVVSTTLQIQGPLGGYLPFGRTNPFTTTFYMPFISNPFSQTNRSALANTILDLANKEYSTNQISSLAGTEQLDQSVVTLQWEPPSNSQYIEGYHVYRMIRGVVEEQFIQIGTVSATVTTYVDPQAVCNGVYYITAFNADGESLPSTSSYYTMPCP